jgi:septum formation protein
MLLNQLAGDYRIILASQSPRRKMLLSGLDIEFEVIVREDIDESFPEGMGMLEIPEYLARIKSDNYLDLLDRQTILITADTIVWYEQKVVGKPENGVMARQILKELSGHKHTVVTGVCIRSSRNLRLFSSVSEVNFRALSDEEIDYYTDRYKPLDKAGAYGIQEWIGYVGIEKIEGSFYNVMGLPVQQLYSELREFIDLCNLNASL